MFILLLWHIGCAVRSLQFSGPLDFSVEYLIFAFKLDPCAFKDGEAAAKTIEMTLDEMNLTQVLHVEGEFFRLVCL